MPAERNPIAERTVVYRPAGMESVSVRREVPYSAAADEGPRLTLDLYDPPNGPALRPAVVFVSGYPDEGYQKVMGCRHRETGGSVSWGRLAAASGMVGVTYSAAEPAPDLLALLRFLEREGAALGVDAGRLALWACSGNAPAALHALMSDVGPRLRGAVLGYGYTLDLDGSTGVAEAAARFRFANPCQGRSLDDLPQGLPLFLARAGRDELPGLNAALDRFAARALARNLPLELHNLPGAPHAFDLLDASDASQEAVRAMLAFLRARLRV